MWSVLWKDRGKGRINQQKYKPRKKSTGLQTGLGTGDGESRFTFKVQAQN